MTAETDSRDTPIDDFMFAQSKYVAWQVIDQHRNILCRPREDGIHILSMCFIPFNPGETLQLTIEEGGGILRLIIHRSMSMIPLIERTKQPSLATAMEGGYNCRSDCALREGRLNPDIKGAKEV
jgi:hypothetical protein